MSSIVLKDIIENNFYSKWSDFCQTSPEISSRILDDPNFFDTLKQVWTISDFVSLNCIKNPELLYELYKSEDIYRSYDIEHFKNKLDVLLLNINDFSELAKVLRSFRVRELIRIAWRDIANLANLDQTVNDLSNFADACIDKSLLLLYRWECQLSGTPFDSKNIQQFLIVLGLGKLGGRELNFSSDIDLIFVYPEPGFTNHSIRPIPNEEFFIILCRKFIKLLNNPTSDGLLFRVDLRLRPFGESGPIVMSCDALEEYYHSQGRDWERYALIKCRIISGDFNAGLNLLKRLTPFIYHRYLDFGIFESLREMKQKISFDAKRKGMKNNIKLCEGGIREIEFFTQIFQLLRGGISPILQNQNLLSTLKTLESENFISLNTYCELRDAYIFFRNIEHRLQEFNDQQTHTIPTDPVLCYRLSLSLGFNTTETFFISLNIYLAIVNNHFCQLLKADNSNFITTGQIDIESILKSLQFESLDKESAIKAFKLEGYNEPQKILDLLVDLINHPNTKSLSQEGKKLLFKLIPLIVKEISHSPNQFRILNRIINLLKTIERRTCYLSLLLENRNSITHLVKLSDLSPWIIDFISLHPVLLDELLDSRSLYYIPSKREMDSELIHQIDRIPLNDFEHQLDKLRIFKNTNLLHIAAANVDNILSLMNVSDSLTNLAEVIVEKTLNLSFNYLINKHGQPSCSLSTKFCERGFAVVAYGKLGGIELGYESDLDLVFLHAGDQNFTNGKDNSIDNYQFFIRLGQRVLHILTTRTSTGILYEADMRLRPNGNSGLLVCHINSFEDYQINSAWTWEHQAIIKARVICGDEFISNKFVQIRNDVIIKKRDKLKLQTDIKMMRDRMRKSLMSLNKEHFDLKQGIGGLIDIEFIVQYLVLLHANKYPDITKFTDIVRIIYSLNSYNIISDKISHILRASYLTFRSAIHRLNLQGHPAFTPNNVFKDLRHSVKNIWNFILNDAIH